ncbi:MAG: hypothetical protein AAFQ65_13280 [Myxococcota bacterium]
MSVFDLLRIPLREAQQATIDAVEAAGRASAGALGEPELSSAVRTVDRYVGGRGGVGAVLDRVSRGDGLAPEPGFGGDVHRFLAASLSEAEGLPVEATESVEAFVAFLRSNPSGAAEAHLNRAILDTFTARSGLSRESSAVVLALRATQAEGQLSPEATRQVVGFADAAGVEGAELQRELVASLTATDPALAQQLADRWGVRLPPQVIQAQQDAAGTGALPELDEQLLALPEVAAGQRVLQETAEGLDAEQLAPVRDLTERLVEAGETGRLDVARALGARIEAVGNDVEALDALVDRADAVFGSIAEEAISGTPSYVRTALPEAERARRLERLFDPAAPLDETVASFPAAPRTFQFAPVPAEETRALLAAEPPELQAARRSGLRQGYRDRPLPGVNPLASWALAGDDLLRQMTSEAIEANGLMFGDIRTARGMDFHRDRAAQTHFELDLNRPGAVQAFEPPPADGTPPFDVQAMLARPFEPDRPTLIYMTELGSAPFDAAGNPLGTAATVLNGLREDMNVIFIRPPYQGDLQLAGFIQSLDNMQTSLASTTQLMDDVVRQVREQAPDQPIVMGGVSLGGTYVNNYRGWFDNGTPESGADLYIPIAAQESGFGGMFDATTTGATLSDGQPVPTWWAASQLHPDAFAATDEVAASLSPSREDLLRTQDEVFALIPRWDDLIHGADEAYEPYSSRYLANEPTTIASHVGIAVPRTVPIIPGLNIPIPDSVPESFHWPARGSIEQTGRNVRDVIEQFLETRDVSAISTEPTRALDR